MAEPISLSVLIVTKNEAANLPRCLNALKGFDEIVVIDSLSTDGTADLARKAGARVVDFEWNRDYPKKRQWCLDTLDLFHERVFFVDADEEVTCELVEEIKKLDWRCAGYFVRGHYVWKGRALRRGATNNKLVLFDRRKVEFPVVDDLDIPGMGEIEGHYQPVIRAEYKHERIGQVEEALLHHAFENEAAWDARHRRYAQWESAMIRRGAYPKDPDPWRNLWKIIFRTIPCRWIVMFLYNYFFCLGFLEGRGGYFIAAQKAKYYFYCRFFQKEGAEVANL